jgi:hypothetical protein
MSVVRYHCQDRRVVVYIETIDRGYKIFTAEPLPLEDNGATCSETIRTACSRGGRAPAGSNARRTQFLTKPLVFVGVRVKVSSAFKLDCKLTTGQPAEIGLNRAVFLSRFYALCPCGL